MAERSRAIKLGLIGCGRVAETCHLPALQNLAGAEVVAVADLDPDRLRRVADRFRLKYRYTNFVALLNDPSREAVAVCVPVQFHVEVVLVALETGKQVFIFDLWRFLLQSEAEEVFAVSRSPHWKDETAIVTARLASGRVSFTRTVCENRSGT